LIDFEVVEVDERERDRAATALGAGDLLVQARLQSAVVQAPGQRSRARRRVGPAASASAFRHATAATVGEGREQLRVRGADGPVAAEAISSAPSTPCERRSGAATAVRTSRRAAWPSSS
jgi:hypothetical protein